MANERILNTRIALKIDSLTNWQTSSLPLKKGEVAIATVAATAGTGLTEPVVMFKVATEDGKTFPELPWAFHAKASDVLTACKSDEGLTAYINNVINNAGLATDGAMTELTNRVATNEGAIATLKGDGEGSVAKAIADAIAALKLADTYETKTDAAQKLADAKLYADQKDTAIAAAKKAGDDAQADVDALEIKVGVVPEDKTVVQMIADAQSAATYDDTALKSRVSANETAISTLNGTGEGSVSKQVADAVAGIINGAPEAYNTLKEISDWISSHADSAATMNSQINTNKDNIASLTTLIGTLPEGADSKTIVAYIDEAIADLKIGDYAKAADLAAAVARIATNETAIKTINETTIPSLKTEVNKYTDDKITALNIGEYAKKVDVESDIATAKSEAISTVRGESTETVATVDAKAIAAQTKADQAYELAGTKATMAEVNEAIGNAGHAAAADLASHTGNTTIHITAAERTAWNAAEQNAKDYADDLNGAMSARVDSVTGTLNTYKESNDAEVAKKIENVTTTANGGLKVTGTNQIDIDDSITFVFDCGNSVV